MNKRSVVLSLSSIGLRISFTGVISGTTAWYAYATRASLSYSGTSVSNTEQLQIGLKVDTDSFASREAYQAFVEGRNERGRSEVTLDNGNTYLFAKPGSPLNSEALNFYLSSLGYASNELSPVTTKDFDWDRQNDAYQEEKHSSFSLYSALSSGETYQRRADKSQYAYLPFAFRVLQIGHLSDPVYTKNQSIWLSDAETVASTRSDGRQDEIKNAIRLFVETDHDKDFLLSPSSKEETRGYTSVGGLLDLNRDGYYDYDSYEFGSREILYGTYEGSKALVRNTEAYGQESVDNINNIPATSILTDNSFIAKHRSNVMRYEDYSGIKIGKAYYETRGTVSPEKNQGSLSGGRVLCTTSDDNSAVAEVGFTLFLEGWDHAVTDNSLTASFSLGLTFEINKVR